MIASRALIRVRVDKQLHARLIELAEVESRSVSNYVARVLRRWVAKAEREAASSGLEGSESHAE